VKLVFVAVGEPEMLHELEFEHLYGESLVPLPDVVVQLAVRPEGLRVQEIWPEL